MSYFLLSSIEKLFGSDHTLYLNQDIKWEICIMFTWERYFIEKNQKNLIKYQLSHVISWFKYKLWSLPNNFIIELSKEYEESSDLLGPKMVF